MPNAQDTKVLVAKTQVVIEPLTEKRVRAAVRAAKQVGLTVEGTTFERCYTFAHGIELLLNCICERIEKNIEARSKRKQESDFVAAIANAKTLEQKIELLKRLEGLRVELARADTPDEFAEDDEPKVATTAEIAATAKKVA
jgi:hypothetical protein